MVSFKVLLAAAFGLCAVKADNNEQVAFQYKAPSTSVTASSILEKSSFYVNETAHTKLFQDGDTLAYVTPWNNHGYDVVKYFKGKFDYISPVWYTVRKSEPYQYRLFGGHDVDQGWIEEVRGEVDGRMVGKVLPRMQLQFITQEDIINLVQDPNEAAALANALTQECIAQKFNGLTLETGVPPHLLRLLIVDLAKKLHDESMELILVIPPIREMVNNNPPIHMSKEEFDHLSQHVDRFSIMTYDFSTSKSGPNAPIDWLRDNLEHFGSTPNAHKLLMGLNLYGMYFTPVKAEPITGSVYLERLRTCEDEEGEPIHKLVWDKINQEHVAECFNDGDEIEIWYPSKRSIHDRLELAKEYGVGLSLWEVGQGLDYFYDRL